jgi:hypothetical protein
LADAATGISKDASNTAIHQDALDSLSGLVHNLKRDANVLIIGPGGGNDVMAARSSVKSTSPLSRSIRSSPDDVLRAVQGLFWFDISATDAAGGR